MNLGDIIMRIKRQANDTAAAANTPAAPDAPSGVTPKTGVKEEIENMAQGLLNKCKNLSSSDLHYWFFYTKIAIWLLKIIIVNLT